MTQRITGAVLVGAILTLIALASAIADVGQLYEIVGPFGVAGLGVLALGLVMIYLGVGPVVRRWIESMLGKLPRAGTVSTRALRGLRVVGRVLVVAGLGVVVFAVVTRSTGDAEPSLRSSAFASTNNSLTLPLPKPDRVQPGDVMIAQVHVRDLSNFSPPPGWTYIDSVQAAGDTMEVFWKTATDAEPANYPFESQKTFGKSGGITAWSGISTVDPIVDHSVFGVQDKAQGIVPSVTVPGPRAPIIMMTGAIGPTSIRLPAEMSLAWTANSPAGRFISTTSCATSVLPGPTSSGEKAIRVGDKDGFGGWEALLLTLRPEGDRS